MQNIEPYFNWRHLYTAETDPLSPFFKRQYNEFEFVNTIYNFYIHPQWDDFGSTTMFMKIIFVDYEKHFAIIELIGEWNDAIENDIMTIRREITDHLYKLKIYKYIIIAENVLNFHSSDDSYYQDWYEQLEDDRGWIVILNMPDQSKYDFTKARLTNYIELHELIQWRTLKPEIIFELLDKEMCNRLN